MTALSAKQLTQKFGGLVAVANLSFDAHPGKTMAIIGPNGAGKTTVFNCISGIYEPTEGVVEVFGRNLKQERTLTSTVQAIGVGCIGGVLSLLLIFSQSLWQVMIVDNYVYQEPFLWTGACQSGFDFLRTCSWFELIGSFSIGFFLGFLNHFLQTGESCFTPFHAKRLGISRTFQNIRLFQNLSVLENVLVGMEIQLSASFASTMLRLKQFQGEEKAARAEALSLLSFVGLENYQEQRADSLPYGLQRRLEIARALASKPKILLLDEPAAGMNPQEASSLMKLIEAIQTQGITILLIEHHMKVVMGVSDSVVVLDYGNKIAEGTPNDVRNNPKVHAAYLGTESASS